MEDFAKVLIVCSFSLCSSNVANLETSRCSLLIQRWRVSLAFFVVSILVQFLGYNDAKPISGGLYYQTDTSIAGFQSRVGCLFFLASRRFHLLRMLGS